MMNADFLACMDFILEIEKLKTVYRQNYSVYEERRENDTEHSWHLAVMAVLLADYCDEKVDVLKTVKTVLIHDIVEIDAGDTYCYDTEGYKTKALREKAAADRIFGMLPPKKMTEFMRLWEEFEAQTTPEAKYAALLDRLQPLMLNIAVKGRSWHEHGVTSDKVIARNAAAGEISHTMADYIKNIIADSVEKGYLEK